MKNFLLNYFDNKSEKNPLENIGHKKNIHLIINLLIINLINNTPKC